MTAAALPFLAKAAPWILGGLGFLGGSQKNKQTQTQTTNNTLDPAYSPLQQALLSQALGKLNAPTALSQSEIAGGVGKINDTYRTIQQGIGNRAAASGMTGSPGEMYAMNNADMARGGDIGQYRAVTVPGLERDLQQRNFTNAANVLGQGRYNQTTTGTSTSGGGLGGGLAGLGGILGFQYGQSGTSGSLIEKLLAQYMGPQAGPASPQGWGG